MSEIIPVRPTGLATSAERFDRVVQATLDDLDSANSKRGYARDIGAFLAWLDEQDYRAIDAATVGAYKEYLRASGKARATINRYLSSVRAFIRKAGQLDPNIAGKAEAATRVKGVKQEGQRHGTRLSQEEAQALIDAPPSDTLRGLRDRALLALLIMTGMRRAEITALRWPQLQQVEGHWTFVDVVRKRGKVQALIPCPPLVYRRLMAYADLAGLDVGGEGPIFVALHKGGYVDLGNGEYPRAVSPQTVYDVLSYYAPDIAPHDLRRTCACIARKNGAPLEQIQHLLGHESVETTDRYTGITLDLDDNATMYIPLQG